MDCFARSHLGEDSLVASAVTHTAQNNSSLAHLLADLGAIEAQKIHLKLGYSSMVAFCVGVLGHCDHEAYVRIRVARIARDFPALLPMIADGRHGLTSVKLLSRHLHPETAADLLEAAAGKSKSEIQHLIAQRFPNRWLVQNSSERLGPERVDGTWSETPIAPGVYDARLLYGQEVHDKLQYLRDLLSHLVPSGNMVEVLDRGLELAIAAAVKRKTAAVPGPHRAARPTATDSRHIPAEVADAVWKRDGGRCTYVSPDGRRCDSTWQLEFDHREEFARGGPATVDNVRVLCRARNQYMAECTFGAGFMQEKRKASADAGTGGQAATRPASNPAALDEATLDVIAGLRNLGVRAERARVIAQYSGTQPHVSFEERMKIALQALRARIATAEATSSTAA